MPGKKRSIVYIDGFNLYYGAVHDTQWKWLDIQTYFERLRQNDDVVKIKYFTALIENNRDARNRQEAYLQALETMPKVEIILGRFKDKTIRCKVRCGYGGSKGFKAPEEKQTDVAMGVHMLDDAYQGKYDRLILVTGDSDLLPAVEMVKSRFPTKTIHLYVPARTLQRGAAVEMRGAAHKDRTLPNNLIQRSQIPDPLTVGTLTIAKPVGW